MPGNLPPKTAVTLKIFFLEKKMSALILIAFVALVVYKLFSRKTVAWRKEAKYGGAQVAVLERAPGPVPFPVVGSLHLLGKSESPFQAFTELAKTYGDVFSITLGSSPCLVVNSLDRIKEVLNQNGKFFGGRPDFMRFHQLFAGDRNNCEYIFFFFNSFFILLKKIIFLIESYQVTTQIEKKSLSISHLRLST